MDEALLPWSQGVRKQPVHASNQPCYDRIRDRKSARLGARAERRLTCIRATGYSYENGTRLRQLRYTGVTDLDRHPHMDLMRAFTLLPFMVLLFVLPFPETVALRLLCLAGAFVIAVALWRRLAPPRIPCTPALVFWVLIALFSLAGAVDCYYSLG